MPWGGADSDGKSTRMHHLRGVRIGWRLVPTGDTAALARTFLPGWSMVPRAERTMLLISNSSTTTKPWFLARSMVVLCSQASRRRA